ncbi:MAG: alpha/beta fold hydrolase [Phycisphaera sp.]|nr:alpha/beta fold hydrolase [Phycisphaera sp.]
MKHHLDRVHLHLAVPAVAVITSMSLAVMAVPDEMSWPPVKQDSEIGGFESSRESGGDLEECDRALETYDWGHLLDTTNKEISGACWRSMDNSLWIAQSNPQVLFQIQFLPEDETDLQNTQRSRGLKVGVISQDDAVIRKYEISSTRINADAGTSDVDYGDLEACAVHADHPGRVYVLSENAGAIIGIDGITDPEDGKPVESDPEKKRYTVWGLEGKDVNGVDGMLPEVDPAGGIDGYGKGTGAEGLEFLSGVDEFLLREAKVGESGEVIGYRTNLRLPGEKLWFQSNFAEPGEPEELGQLALVGHQHDGRIYVFEINLAQGGEFINHGFYRTGANEVCGLHWDRLGSDLYILHGQELGNPNWADQRNSLEVMHLGQDESGDRHFETTHHFKENVPGNEDDHGTVNYESIALLDRNCEGGAGPHQRVMFLVEDDECAEEDGTPVRWFLLPHTVNADLNHDGQVDDLDMVIMDLAIEDGNLEFDVNGDGVVDQGDQAEIFAQEILDMPTPDTGSGSPAGSSPLKETTSMNVVPGPANRPQEPVPPFPYRSDEVVYENATAGIELAGTLTIPEGAGPFPAVVLITGSGAQDRDCSIFGHKLFHVIADHLTRHGIAVLRVDDRGVGGSTSVAAIGTATSFDFAGDVAAGVSFLRRQSDIDPEAIGLIGHSEGGMIAPLVAAEDPGIAFVVMMAGPGIPVDELLLLQDERMSRAHGIDEASIVTARRIQREVFDIMLAGDSLDDEEEGRIRELLLESPGIGSGSEAERMVAVEDLLGRMNTPWFRAFLGHDPGAVLPRVTCPVLALNGELDLQVTCIENLAGVTAGLERGRNSDFKVLSLPDLNHPFQHCKTGITEEYAEIEETISPEVLEIMVEWILPRVANDRS